MKDQTLRFLSNRLGVDATSLRVTFSPLTGGLESNVSTVVVNTRRRRRSVPRRFVVKELRGTQRREAAIYEAMRRTDPAAPIPRLYGATCEEAAAYLYLEELRACAAWPWTDVRLAALVCQALARLHRTAPLATVFLGWDYEAELRSSATETVALAETARTPSGERSWKRCGDLRRVARALPQIRRELLGAGRAVIHGDMHPGNVIVRRRGRGFQAQMIDWARARVGSPFEDVASWLHSLGCWEPEARRRHDTLLQAYLRARGIGEGISARLRRHYWLASASNGLSGAIRYHLSVVADPAANAVARTNGAQALRAWERVMRRAAALLPPRITIEAQH
jgi:aminoglycoside phosphotransferase (APT) family kinase protein